MILSRVLYIDFLIIFALLLPPAVLVLAVLMSLDEVFRAIVNVVPLTFDLAWFAGSLLFHVVNSLLHLLGLVDPERVFRSHRGVKHFAGEVINDLRCFGRLPRALLSNFCEVVRRIEPLVRRVRRRFESRPERPGRTVFGGWRPRRGVYDFEKEYSIVERLAAGGSTAQLFVVRQKKRGDGPGEKLVLKYFDLTFGSHLENIIRESGAVRLATKLGIVRDSSMTKKSFYYVMPYYRGATLTNEILGSCRGGAGSRLPTEEELTRVLKWTRRLLEIIAQYHDQGVFHKDIKPDNLIVQDDRLHLVDIGLLTPFESTLQLTTHGTEYFRDPEMVKLAVRGVSIRDVDCAKFDLYSIGAVLYFMVEGAFPSSGSLSSYASEIPFCVQWICNKAMTDFPKRYSSARQMLRDVEDLLALAGTMGLEAVKVSSLSSFRAVSEPSGMPVEEEEPSGAVAAPDVDGGTPEATDPAATFEGAPGTPAGRRFRFPRVIPIVLLLLLSAAVVLGAAFWMDERSRAATRFRKAVTAATFPPSKGQGDGMHRSSILGRDEAVEAIAAAIDGFRSRIRREVRRLGGRSLSSPMSALLLPLGTDGTEVGELHRDIKLSLARRSVPFETDVDGSSLRTLTEMLAGLPPSHAHRLLERFLDARLPGSADSSFLATFRVSEEQRAESPKEGSIRQVDVSLRHRTAFDTWSLRYRP